MVTDPRMLSVAAEWLGPFVEWEQMMRAEGLRVEVL